MSTIEATTRIFTFDGTHDQYPVWSAKYLALCSVKGCRAALDPRFGNKLPASEDASLNESDDDEKKQSVARKQNALALNYLVMSFEKPRLLAKIEASKTADWPSGLAHVVWSKLEEQYRPSDTIAVAEQMSKLMKLKLNKDKNPDDLGDELAEIETMYRSKLGDKEKVAAVVQAAGHLYADTIRQETKNIEVAGETVTAEALIGAMSEKWRISGGKKNASEESDNSDDTIDTTLSNVDTKKFGSECYGCGRFGHKKNDCPFRGKSFKGMCNNCGKRGHKEADCWDKEENAHKRPKGWKSKNDDSSGANIEVLL